MKHKQQPLTPLFGTKSQQKIQIPHLQLPPQISQQQLQQKHVNLQTILLLTQLNSTYQQMKISLIKVFNKIDKKYLKLKMKSFIKIMHHGHNKYQIRGSIQEEQNLEMLRRCMVSEKGENGGKSRNSQIIKRVKIFDKQQVQLKVIMKTKIIFSKIYKLINKKMLNTLSFSLHMIKKQIHQNSIININSNKSSKILTADSHKVFKRSTQNNKRTHKKSFSVGKNKPQQRKLLHAPVIFDPYRNTSPFLSAQYSSSTYTNIQDDDLSPSLNRFMQSSSHMTAKQKRINLVNLYRNRSNKSTSNQKYVPTAPKLVLNQKDEAIKQLFYLKKKYKKLIAQFKWFSQRFLKVIEEQKYLN